MNPLARLFKKKPEVKALDLSHMTSSLGTIPFNTLRTLTHMQSDDYENGYSSIRWIAKRFFVIKPYAIDENGEKLEQTPNVMQLLSRPNRDMSGVKFRDAMAVMNMVHDKTYILVWERRGNEVIPATPNVKEETIAGFTFLENVYETVEDGEVVYNTTFGSTPTKFYRHQVMTDYEVNPRNLSQGYSPSQAAKRWKTIDDYIADYQRGFFQNGAVPSGMFLISAPTDVEVEDIKEGLKKHHQGAGKNDGVVYSHVPTDPNTGKQEQATITWVPFNVNNKDMALKDLFEQANSKIDAVYGVSKFLRMLDDAAPNRSVAQSIEKMAVEDIVRPFAIQRWSQFQHELNRITGGLGYAITFDLEVPNVSEDEEAGARADLTRVQALNLLTANNYTLDSVIEALGLPERFKALEAGTSTAIEEEKVDIDSGDNEELPENPIARVKGEAKGTNPKAELTDEGRIYEAAKDFMRSQIDLAIAELDEEVVAQEPTDDQLDTFVLAMMAVITGILIAYGEEGYAAGVAIAGLNIADLQGFNLPELAEDGYAAYLRGVGQSYGNDTAESLRKALLKARDEGLTLRETKERLRNVLNTDEWRIERLARTELNNSQGIGKLEGFKNLRDEVGGTWEKTITHAGVTNPCPLCASQEGIWTSIDEPLWAEGDSITTTNDKGETVVYVNDWYSNEAHDYHPNGRGTLIFRRTD